MQIDQQYLHVNYSEYINIKAYTGLFKTNDVTIQNISILNHFLVIFNNITQDV